MLSFCCYRFEEAVAAAEQSTQLDPTNKEGIRVAKWAKVVSSARLSGNLLFKESRFSEACIAYSEGLENDPYNSILLCNRAACRSKLGQYEKAVEDCTAALHAQPSYSKARLRRADCNAKVSKKKLPQKASIFVHLCKRFGSILCLDGKMGGFNSRL